MYQTTSTSTSTSTSAPQHQVHKTEHDAKPGLIHKIADKLGIHKSDKTDDHHKYDGTTHPHDNDPNRIHAHDPSLIHEKDKDNKPGLGHKIADKLGMHKDDKHDHHHTDKTVPVHKPTELHNYQTGVRDNDPNRVQPHHETGQHHTTTNTTGVKDKVEDKLGMDKSHDHHHHSSTDATHGHGQTHATHGQTHATHGQTHGTTTGSMTHGHQQPNIDIGGYPVNPSAHNTASTSTNLNTNMNNDVNNTHNAYTNTNTHTNTHTNTNLMGQEHLQNQRNISSAGVTDNVRSKLGMNESHDHDLRNKDNEAGNLFGLPATNPDRVGQNNNIDDFRTASPGFGAGQPPVPGQAQTHSSDQHQRTQDLHLPKMTPQAEAGSVYSSSMIDNNNNSVNPSTIDHNRQGHATSTGYTTTGTSHDLPVDTGRTYQN